jgi:MIP family channel proteins
MGSADLSSAPTLSEKFRAELLGTFVFVLIGAGSALGSASLAGAESGSLLIVAALANGMGLAVAVTATLKVSGGSLNPAVSLALWTVRKLKTREMVAYIIAEFAGASLAGVALIAAFPSDLGNSANWGAPSLNGAVSSWQGIAIEALMTFVLVFVIYGTAVDARAPRVGGIAIGLAVLADVMVAGNLTGAAMNPARAYGPMIANLSFPGYWYIYTVGPVVGAVLAALAYRYFIERPSD